jgi:hypothetical protein
MAGDASILVQSLAAGYPVAVTYENVAGVGTGGIQWMQSRSSGQPIGAVVASIAGVSQTVGSVLASQGAAPWTFTGSATIQGSVQATVAGSVYVTQATSPWVVLPTSTGQPQGTVVASVIGVPTVVGSVSVTGSVGALVIGSVQATVVGSVLASQGAAPWTVTGSIQATQATSPWVTLAGSTGFPQGTMVASVIGVPTMVGSVQATQATSPWIILAGSTGTPQGTVVASIIGIPTFVGSVSATGSVQATVAGSVGALVAGSVQATVIGSVLASQGAAPWTFTGSVGLTMANTLQPLTVIVTSQLGGGSTITGSVFATLTVSGGAAVAVTSLAAGGALKVDLVQGTITGADGAILDGVLNTTKASVRSYASGINPLVTQLVSSGGVLASVTSLAAGGALKVDLVQGTISGADGAILDGVDNTIKTTVRSYAAGKPVAVNLTDLTGAAQWPLATVGSVSVVGSVGALVAGSVQATVVGSVLASQGAAPWAFTGSVQATQATSPWVVLPGSTGQPQGTVVASVIGIPTVVGSVSVTGSVGALVIGSVQATVLGSVTATQGAAPWTMVGSVSVTGSVGAVIAGSVQATVIGSVQTIGTLATSFQVSSAHPPVLIGGFALPAGTVPAAVGSYGAIPALFTPTGLQRVAVDSGQATIIGSITGTIVASVIGVPTVVGSVSVTGSVGALVIGSVTATQGAAPWTFTGSTAVTMANTLQPLTVIVTSQMGGGSTITGSVFATLTVSGGALVAVTSLAAGGALKVDLVQGTISGADGAILDGVLNTTKASVRSYASGVNPLVAQLVSSGGVLAEVTSLAAGNALKVDLVQGTISGANGAILDGTDNTIKASVRSYASGVNPLVTQLVSSGGVLADVMSLAPAGFGGPALHVVAGGTLAVGAATTNTYPLLAGAVALDPTSGTMTAVGSRTMVQVWADAVGRLIVRTDSVAVTQANTAAPFTVIVTSQMGGGSTITGSVQATQASSPWVTLAGSTGAPQGTIVASVIGVPTVVGSVSVTGSVGAVVAGSVQATIIGSVLASQGAAPWTVTGSTAITMANTLQPLTVIVTSQMGGGNTITGSVQATQASSPWVTLAGSTGAPQGTIVASVIGVPTVVGSVQVTQATSPWAVLPGSTGQPQGTVVASVIGVPTFVGSVIVVGSVGALVAGSVQATVMGSVQAIGTLATSFQVSSAHPPLLIGGFALPAGIVPAAVGSYGAIPALFTPTGLQRVAVDSGQVTMVGSIAGTVVASVIGVPTIVGSVSVTGSVGALVIGSVQATVVGSVLASQGAAPWTFIGSTAVTMANTLQPLTVIVTSQMGGGNTITGSVQATQASSPWVTLAGSTGAPQGTIVASVIGVPTVVGSVQVTQATSPWVVLPGSTGQPQGTVVASVIGVPTVVGSVSVTGSVGALVIGSVTATQGAAPWTFIGSTAVTMANTLQPLTVIVTSQMGGGNTITGSVQATQASSPWIVMAGSTGQPQGTVVASIIGVPTFVGSVQVTQATSPWVVLPGSTGQPQGTVVASVIGVPTVVGSVQATQASSPWAVFPGSTGAFQGFMVASLIGQPTVTASVIGTIASSIAGTVVCSFESTVWAAIGSSTQGAGIVSIAASITAPASITGGALNVRNFGAQKGTVNLLTAQVFSRGIANFVQTVTASVTGVDMYDTFMLYVGLTKTNTPTDIRIRPRWNDGVTVTSYFDMGQGFWQDMRISDDVILASSLYQRVFIGPVLGPSVSFEFVGDTATGSGSMTLDAWVQFNSDPLYMAT